MALSLSSCAGSVSVLILFCTSWILANRVDSSASSTMGFVASSVVSPSLRIMTRFLHLAHHSWPFLSLNSGEAHAGHEYSVSVAPCLSRLAMFWRSFESVVIAVSSVAKRFYHWCII